MTESFPAPPPKLNATIVSRAVFRTIMNHVIFQKRLDLFSELVIKMYRGAVRLVKLDVSLFSVIGNF